MNAATILGVIYGVVLWADMNATTPLGAWLRSAISAGNTPAVVPSTHGTHGAADRVTRDVVYGDYPMHGGAGVAGGQWRVLPGGEAMATSLHSNQQDPPPGRRSSIGDGGQTAHSNDNPQSIQVGRFPQNQSSDRSHAQTDSLSFKRAWAFAVGLHLTVRTLC